jgi:ATP-dependent protease ClpP protease subunit
MDATSPKDIDTALTDANGDDLEIEINSGGGSVFVGSEIYTALKDYKGKKIVKVVGLAASAASVIAMAGDVIKISPTAQIMIHNASNYAEGDYRDMEHQADILKGINKSISNAYILKTGMKQEDLLSLMDQETWLNAQKAKELGFADEIMFDEGNQLVASTTTVMLPPEVINKMINTAKTHEITPQNSGLINKQEPAKPQPVKNQKEEGNLEIKNTDELRQNFPEFVAQVEAAAREDGATNERQRIKSIDEIANTVAPELVAKAKYDEPMNAEKLAFEALKNDSLKGRQYLDNLNEDNDESGAKRVGGQPQLQNSSKEKEAEERATVVNAIAEFAAKRRNK